MQNARKTINRQLVSSKSSKRALTELIGLIELFQNDRLNRTYIHKYTA